MPLALALRQPRPELALTVVGGLHQPATAVALDDFGLRPDQPQYTRSVVGSRVSFGAVVPGSDGKPSR
jgi:hypothetical protein